jgi:hypothetical protein
MADARLPLIYYVWWERADRESRDASHVEVPAEPLALRPIEGSLPREDRAGVTDGPVSGTGQEVFYERGTAEASRAR